VGVKLGFAAGEENVLYVNSDLKDNSWKWLMVLGYIK
jgi:hypothetical protein